MHCHITVLQLIMVTWSQCHHFKMGTAVQRVAELPANTDLPGQKEEMSEMWGLGSLVLRLELVLSGKKGTWGLLWVGQSGWKESAFSEVRRDVVMLFGEMLA